jgi:hypothetical protein
MTFKHIKFNDSPVMRELARQAVAKGDFSSEEEVRAVVKIASSKKKVSYEPTDNLELDIMKLARGLRERGFEKDADSLEHQFTLYKEAETHLYRVIDEDGDDLIDFAHPDGEVPITDSKDGVVETQLTQHKKIVDIVNKAPTGNVKAANALVSEAANILGIRTAEDVPWDTAELTPDVPKKTNMIDERLGSIKADIGALQQIIKLEKAPNLMWGRGAYLGDPKFVLSNSEAGDATLSLVQELDQAQDDEIEVLFLRSFGSFVLGKRAITTKDIANKNLLTFFLNRIPEGQQKWSQIVAGKRNFDDLFNQENIDLVNRKIGELKRWTTDKLLEVTVPSNVDLTNSDSINRTIEQLNVAQLKLQDVFRSNKTGDRTGMEAVITRSDTDLQTRFNRLLDKVNKDITYVVSILKGQAAVRMGETTVEHIQPEQPVASKDKQQRGAAYVEQPLGGMKQVIELKLRKLVQALKPYAKSNPQEYNDFLKLWQVWQKHTGNPSITYSEILKQMAATGALDNPNNYKTVGAFDRLIMSYEDWVRSAKNASVKSELTKKAVPAKPPAAAPGKAAPSGWARSPDPPPAEKEAVRGMQSILNDLGRKLNAIPVAERKEKFPGATPDIIGKLLTTGPQRGRPVADTAEALDGKWAGATQKAINAAKALGIEGLVNGPTYLRNNPKAPQMAETNREAIAQFMSSKGLEVPNSAKFVDFDRIKPGAALAPSDSSPMPNWIMAPENDPAATIPVLPLVFSSLYEFEKFATNNNLASKLRKATRKELEEQFGRFTEEKGFTVTQWKNLLGAFYARASVQANAAKRQNKDVARKTAYLTDVVNLFARLQAAVGSETDPNKVVTAYDIESKQLNKEMSKLQGQQGQQPGGAYTNEGGEVNVTQSSVPSLSNPLSDDINLTVLKKYYPSALANYSRYKPNLLYTEWNINQMYTSPEQFSARLLGQMTYDKALNVYRNLGYNVKLPNNVTPEYMAFLTRDASLVALFRTLQMILTDLGRVMAQYDQYLGEGKVSRMNVRNVRNAWNQWSDALTEMIRSAERDIITLRKQYG